MPRRSWVQINGRLYEKGVDQIPDDPRSKSAAVYGDLPDFISPIDGKVVSGRAGMRDHCARHNVVPTADLKGLPIGPPRIEPNRAEIREEIRKQLYK
jgi:hypothetical protein